MNRYNGNLWKESHYTLDTDYIVSTYIREYDISKANISILRTKNVISEEQYQYLYNAPRMERQITIGMLLKDPKKSDILKQGLAEARYNFLSANNIPDTNILSIKNDAIFVISTVPTITKFGLVEFRFKNIYTSYYRLPGKIECYYLYDIVSNNEVLDIKGISDSNLLKHSLFLDFLKTVFFSAQCENIQNTIDIIINAYNNYIQLNFPIEMYRRFSSDSMYQLKQIFKYDNSLYMVDGLTNDNINQIDISYNLNIIRSLYQIFSGEYFLHRKR